MRSMVRIVACRSRLVTSQNVFPSFLVQHAIRHAVSQRVWRHILQTAAIICGKRLDLSIDHRLLDQYPH